MVLYLTFTCVQCRVQTETSVLTTDPGTGQYILWCETNTDAQNEITILLRLDKTVGDSSTI